MGKIVLLDDLTINKIAAGEVIERPASVVKEMVENSIDAGAKNITVEIKNGGISLIKITDDGCGLAEDDMEIAFERHATSKIRKADDLETVTTMGFRGEALASIASIANVEMISKRTEDETGHRISIEGGKILGKSEVGAPVGTTITVKNLFFNTPVRYKFLKKDFTEAGYIEDVITRIALVNKNVAIKLINTGRTVIQTNGNGDSKSVIYSIYGKDIANGIMDVDYTFENMKVTGVVGKAEIARNNRAHQLFFVNNRYVKDKNLSSAVDQAYKGIVPSGKYGFVILNLELDPKKVDVNVHPAKLEVRFEEDGKVFKAIYHAIKSGLAKGELIENIERPINIDKKSAEASEENKQENKEDNQTEEFKPKKNSFTGFFKKLMKEPDETAEEMENNSLREIFEYRKNAKERLFNSEVREAVKSDINVGASLDSTTSEMIKNDNSLEIDKKALESEGKSNVNVIDTVNMEVKKESFDDTDIELKDENLNEIKEAKIGNTIISSDTKEIEFNVTDNLKNSETLKLDSLKNVVDNVQKTEIVNTLKNIKNTEDTEIEEKENKLENTENSENTDENKLEETDSESIDNVTEKLLKMKIEANIEDTQLVDTFKIREELKEPITPEFANMYKKVFGTEVADVRKTKEEEEAKINISSSLKFANQENMNVFENEETYIPEIKYNFIGIIFSTYIIIQIQDEMYMIDQHAAHERIMYEKVKENYYSETEKDSQMLLLADIVTLTHKEMSIARENVEMFQRAGFDFEEFGENTIKLTAVPSMCEELNTKKLFLEILDEIDTVAVTAKQEKEDKFIATVACKAAVKGNMKLDEKEVESLMNKLLSLPNPFSCPHGRPTAIKITKADLEKKFSRR